MNNAVPSPREFKCALRSAALSQFLRANPKGNYMCSDGVALVGIQGKQQPCTVVIFRPTPQTLENIVVDEGFRYVCGYTVSQIMKNFKTCHNCAEAITGSCSDLAENDWLRVKSYLPHKVSLVVPSKAASELLKLCEAFFGSNVESLLQNRASLVHIKKEIFKDMVTDIPTCHDVPRKLVTAFLRTRIHIFLKNKNEALVKEAPQPKCGSRSVGMREAVRAIR